jgi:outer membrane murein-binding lipoprotein Lpp
MKRLLIVPLILISLIVSGCANTSKAVYRNQLQELKTAYQKNEISKAEYLKLKMEAENAYEHRKATIRAGKLAAPS